MRQRLRTWLDETHGSGFELLRHFLGRLFESDMFGVPGEWQKVAGGVLAAVLSLGILALTTYMKRFDRMREAGLAPSRIFGEMRADELTFIALAMGITALLTALVWQSLFPSLGDCLAMAGLPVSARQIFLAKAGALLLAFAVFVFALNLPWAMMYAAATAGGSGGPSALTTIAANFAGMGAGCVFVFFSLLACQAILLQVLPSRMFERASLIAQAAVFLTTLGLLPLVGRQPTTAAWWPAVWFVGLWEGVMRGSWSDARLAVLAVALSIVIAAVGYLLSYYRYRRVLLEAPPPRSSHRRTGVGSWLLERWIGDPRQQAAFAFIWKTLARSRAHRLILLAYGGIALGAITKTALDMPRPSLRNEGMYGLLVVLAPLAVAMLVTVGLRYLFRLPESHRASWVFQSTDRDGRASWLAAVERFVVCCGIAPIFLASLPAAIAILGWLRALAATLLAFLTALLWFEAVFRQWQKLPFTCSYLPGQRPVWSTLTRYAVGASFLGPLGFLILHSSGEPAAFLALVTFQAAVWWKLRSARKTFWSTCALCYEETPEAAVMSLDLQAAASTPGSLAMEHPREPAPLFAHVGSPGLLPQDWVEEIRNERRSPAAMLETAIEDARYALRLIRRNPLFSVVVVLILTVGIGINASVFTVVNGIALRPHVSQDPASFVRIHTMTRLDGKQRQVSYSEYVAWRDQTRSLRQLAAFSPIGIFVGSDDPSGSEGLAVSCNFFSVDGFHRALLGRLLVAEDCQSSTQPPVAVISESLWRNRFGADANMIGRAIEINNHPVTVVGVVPEHTSVWARWRNEPFSVWMPYTALTRLEPESKLFTQKETLWLSLAGRLAPGFSRSTAQAEFNVLAQQQDRLNPGRRTAVVTTDGSWGAQFRLTASGKQLMLLGFFFGTFNLVLFLSCANVATLMLSRAAARQREIAVRLSLGAPRIRVLRMLVTESLLLAAVAGAISIYLAARVPEPLSRLVTVGAHDLPMPPDWRTFSYVAAVVLLTGVLAGAAPALESLRVDLTASLKGSGAAFLGPAARTPIRGLLVSAQVALSMVLLVEAALFARSEERALRADPGYSPQRVVVAYLPFPDDATIQSVRARTQAIVDRVQALPGVRSAAFSDHVPLMRPDTVELRPPARQDATQPVDVYTASPRFFETLGIALLHGREFQESDAPSAIVSQSLAKIFWPRQNPIGKVLPLPDGALPVIGVARDLDPTRIGGSEHPAAYRLRRPDTRFSVMSVRFDTGASTGVQAVRAAVRQVDPHLPVFPIYMQAWIDRITAHLWNVVALMSVLGIVGTVLATTGIYGAVSFAVNQRTKDLGIRVALGATRWNIVREVFRFGGEPVLQGLIVGFWMSVAVAAGLRESVNSPILRIDSSEPLSYCGAALLLGVAALVAMIGPARRGANTDPLTALRCE
jgi:predicted permease